MSLKRSFYWVISCIFIDESCSVTFCVSFYILKSSFDLLGGSGNVINERIHESKLTLPSWGTPTGDPSIIQGLRNEKTPTWDPQQWPLPLIHKRHLTMRDSFPRPSRTRPESHLKSLLGGVWHQAMNWWIEMILANTTNLTRKSLNRKWITDPDFKKIRGLFIRGF